MGDLTRYLDRSKVGVSSLGGKGMIASMIIIVLAFSWLGYETDWMRVRLPCGQYTGELFCHLGFAYWLDTFALYNQHNMKLFIAKPDYSQESQPKTGYAVYRTLLKHNTFPEIHAIYVSPNTDTLVSRQWLDKHWADLNNYHPTVELYFGNGYKQTFTLKKPEIIGKIIKINTGKKYFRQLAKA